MRSVIRTVFIFFIASIGRTANGQSCGFDIDTSKILSNQELKSLITNLASDKHKSYVSKSSLPKKVLEQLECLTQGFSMADKGFPFQDNCSPNPALPKRQLDCLYIGSRTLLLTYLTGGDGIQNNILIMEYSAKGIKKLWYAASLDFPQSPKEVKEMFKEGTLFNLGIVRL